jgi:dephospho-CoA kinase
LCSGAPAVCHRGRTAGGGKERAHFIPVREEDGKKLEPLERLVVDCPPALQMARVAARDGETSDGAAAILAAQASREERLAAADDVLDNSGTLAALDAQVGALHERYLALARAAAGGG